MSRRERKGEIDIPLYLVLKSFVDLSFVGHTGN